MDKKITDVGTVQDPEDLLFESLKDKFQGFDANGNVIINDEGKIASFDSKDFPKLNQQLKDQFGNKSFEEDFNKKQFEDLTTQGNKFQGFSGDQAIFRNEKGDLENFGNQGGFAKFLQKQQPNASFDAAQKAESGRSNTSYQAKENPLNQTQNTSQNTKSGIGAVLNAQRNVAKNIINPNNSQQDFQKDAIPPKSVPEPEKLSFGVPSREKLISQSAKNVDVPAKTTIQKPTMLQTGVNLLQDKAQLTLNNKAAQAKNSLQNQATQAAAQSIGVSDKAITNPAEYAKQQAIMASTQATGLPTEAILNPTQYALNQATQAGSSALGIDPTMITNPQAFAKQQAINALANQTGLDSGYLGAAAGLLSGGNVAQNAQNLALEQAKKQALASGVEALGSTALSSIPGGVGGAIAGLSALSKGGTSEQKGSAAAKAAALATLQTALAGPTMGLSYLINPALLSAGAGASEKLGSKMGSAGFLMSPTTQALDLGAKNLNEALGAVGDMGSRTGRSFSQAGQGLKAITKGNLGEGLKGLGSALGNQISDALLKNPATLLKSGWKVGGNILHGAGKAVGGLVKGIAKIFCFAPDTPILMANGKYKKIKDIKLGDEVMLGGKVTAIGQSTSDDMFTYNGIEVSGSHALYEDGRWKRVKDSQYAIKLDLPDDTLVYPMATENHLIVTKNQIWADLVEVDDTYDKKDSDILKELNNQKKANAMLDMFLNTYFKKKK